VRKNVGDSNLFYIPRRIFSQTHSSNTRQYYNIAGSSRSGDL